MTVCDKCGEKIPDGSTVFTPDHATAERLSLRSQNDFRSTQLDLQCAMALHLIGRADVDAIKGSTGEP